MSNRRVVRLVNVVRTADPVVLGGKGRGLADMAALGLPVPPAFVITTSVSRALLYNGAFPKRLQWHLQRGIAQLERQTGKRFGNPAKPLLLSARSGAPVSMPGMMDTILNLGMTDDIVDTLAEQYGDEFAEDCRSRFFEMFMSVTQPNQTIREVPQDPWTQLQMAIEAVCASWFNDRAVAYRRANNIPDNLGTAVVVQAMVFGNMDDQSCTGVVFSRNVTTGQPGMYGEFLVNAQGEDVVSGTHTGRPISEMRDWNESLYHQLAQYVAFLERYHAAVVDVEFTVQSGTLYLLQVRKAKLTPVASATIAVHDVWAGKRTKENAVANLTREDLDSFRNTSFGTIDCAIADVLARGLPVSAGAVVGQVALTSAQAIDMAKAGKTVVLVRPDTTPEDLQGMLASKAIVTANGGATCHAAVVARGMGITAVVGCNSQYYNGNEFLPGMTVSVDGLQGVVIRGALSVTNTGSTKEINILTKWARQLRPELLMVPPHINWSSANTKFNMSAVCANFYLSDAMAQAAKGTSLATKALALRNEIHQETAEMLACYLTMAVWGELTHILTNVSEVATPLSKELKEKFGFVRSDRMFSNWHHQSDHTLCQKMLEQRDIAAAADFLDLAARAFRAPCWGGAFGGPKWAAIAEAPRDFLRGTVNNTVFVDHAFDLQHNGGQLFDKHPMVNGTREGCLREMLGTKKDCSGVGELYAGLMRWMRLLPWRHTVVALYKEGVALKIWKPDASEEGR